MDDAPNLLAGNAFYYYDDLDKAVRFYTEVLGWEPAADFGYARMLRIASDSYLTLVDAAHGRHRTDQPKSVTLALVTDELEAWQAHLKAAGLPFERELAARPGSAHDGFVVRDPEGYFLEFERFNPHPENELLLPALAGLRPVPAGSPERGVCATVTWLYTNHLPEAQSFYERLLGKTPLADQGWAKVYPLAGSSFLGLVDGEKGLHRASRNACVTISFVTGELEAWRARVKGVPGFRLQVGEIIEEAGRVRLFVGTDPGGYILEWDQFFGNAAPGDVRSQSPGAVPP